MFLTEKHRLVPFFPSCNNPIPLSDTFDAAISSRLISFLSISPTENLLSWLTHACELLSLTISDATSLLLHQRNSSLGLDQSRFLDSTTLYLLDSCNLVSALLEKLRHRLLFICFSLKSKKITLSEKKPMLQLKNTVQLLSAMEKPKPKPRHGKNDSAQNAICAVEAISALVIGAIWVTLSGKGDEYLQGLKVNTEIFAWGKDFNKVLDVMSKRIGDGSVYVELEKMEATIGELTAEMDLNGEMERTCEEMRERLEKLNGSVNTVFQAALCARNAAVHNLMGGAQKKY